MILPFVGFVIFIAACLFFTFLGILVLRWTDPRVGKSTWSLFAFVVGSWPGSVAPLLAGAGSWLISPHIQSLFPPFLSCFFSVESLVDWLLYGC